MNNNKLNIGNVQADYDRHNNRHTEGDIHIDRGWVKWIIITICLLALAAVIIIPLVWK